MSSPLGPWQPWDLRGEPWGRSEYPVQGRTVYVSKLPEGLYLARFVELARGQVLRFFGETGELALQHAADYINDFCKSAERRELVLADADSSARSLRARVIRELEERKRREGSRP